jgi:DNA-binding phage protein
MRTKQKRKKRAIRFGQKKAVHIKKLGFLGFLEQIRREIFSVAFDPDICDFATVNDLADEAGLCWATVDNLYRGTTKEPRLSTFFKLCKAVGMDINLVKEGLRS